MPQYSLDVGRGAGPPVPLGCRKPAGERRRRAPAPDSGPGASPRKASPADRFPKFQAGLLAAEPAASITARTSSMRWSRPGNALTRSDRPVPRLSNMMTRALLPNWSSQRAKPGSSQQASACDTKPGASDRSTGPSAEHLVGDMDVAAFRIARDEPPSPPSDQPLGWRIQSIPFVEGCKILRGGHGVDGPTRTFGRSSIKNWPSWARLRPKQFRTHMGQPSEASAGRPLTRTDRPFGIWSRR